MAKPPDENIAPESAPESAPEAAPEAATEEKDNDRLPLASKSTTSSSEQGVWVHSWVCLHRIGSRQSVSRQIFEAC